MILSPFLDPSCHYLPISNGKHYACPLVSHPVRFSECGVKRALLTCYWVGLINDFGLLADSNCLCLTGLCALGLLVFIGYCGAVVGCGAYLVICLIYLIRRVMGGVIKVLKEG